MAILLPLLCQLLTVFVIALVGRIILSFFPIAPGSAMSTVYGILYTVTEPVLGPIRSVLPALGPIDISPMLVIFAISILQRAICG